MELPQKLFWDLKHGDRNLILGMISHIQRKNPINHVTESNPATDYAIFCSPQDMAMYTWSYLELIDKKESRYEDESESWENLKFRFFSELLRTTSGRAYITYRGAGPDIVITRITSLAIVSEIYLHFTIRGFFPQFHSLLPRN